MLKSKTIFLRAIEEKDLSLIASWRSSAEIYESFHEYTTISLLQQFKWYESQLSNSSEINFIIASPDGKAIGTVSIYRIDSRNRKAEWGRLLIGDKNYRQQGIGSVVGFLIMEYAFEHLNLHKLYCEVLDNNAVAISLYKKLGFHEEGILREHIFKSGRYMNVLVHSILSAEYYNEKNSGKLRTIFEQKI